MRQKTLCTICNKEVLKSNFTKHLIRHENGKIKERVHLDHDNLECKYCNKPFVNKKAVIQHEIRCPLNENRKDVVKKNFNNKGKSSYTKGKQLSEERKESIRLSKIGKKRNFSEETIKEMVKKGFETKKKRNTLNSSKAEDYVYEKLIEKFGNEDVIRSYSSDVRYPFNCDFYIKSRDLFIELNAHWSHGKRLFNEDDITCVEQLNHWKEKSLTSKYYLNAIKTWTVRDVKKQKIAQKNNINYLVIYSIKDLDKIPLIIQ